MSFKKIATSAAVIAGLVAANVGPLATAASARDWNKGHDRGYARHYDGPRHFHDNGPRYGYGYGYKRHRHNHGKDIAKGLAIGLGVLAVGSIIAHSR
jgi:hypothetical protein